MWLLCSTLWIYKLKEATYVTQHKDIDGNTHVRATTDFFFFFSKPKL